MNIRKIKDEAAGKRESWTERTVQPDQQAHRTGHIRQQMSPAESENTLNTQAATSTRSASAVGSPAAADQPSESDPVANIQPMPTKKDLEPPRFEDLTIYIGTITESNHGQIFMRKTLRDPQTWFKNLATQAFNFENVRRSVGALAGEQKEIFFFPQMSHDPHTALDEGELHGAIQHLYKQSATEQLIKSISLSVAADIDHVRALSLDQRGESSLVII